MGNKLEKKIEKKDMIFVYIQMIVTIIVLVLFFIYMFNNKSVLGYLEIAVAIDLFLTGYNNVKIYKRSNITIYYIIFGVILLVLAIMNLLGK